MPARKIHVTGSVQGVFFRAHTQEKAEELELKGWARNTNDGCVEIHAEGPIEALKELEEWCHHGPAAATVESVEVKETDVKGYDRFKIVY